MQSATDQCVSGICSFSLGIALRLAFVPELIWRDTQERVTPPSEDDQFEGPLFRYFARYLLWFLILFPEDKRTSPWRPVPARGVQSDHAEPKGRSFHSFRASRHLKCPCDIFAGLLLPQNLSQPLSLVVMLTQQVLFPRRKFSNV